LLSDKTQLLLKELHHIKEKLDINQAHCRSIHNYCSAEWSFQTKWLSGLVKQFILNNNAEFQAVVEENTFILWLSIKDQQCNRTQWAKWH